MIDRRRIVKAAMVLAVVGAVLLFYSYFIEPHRLVVREAEVEIPGLDSALSGLRIAMISDIHGGSNGVDVSKLREVVARTNEQNADIVVLLGDFVSHRPASPAASIRMPVELIADGLTGIKARFGVFAVLGNHDGWFGDAQVAYELERVGFRVLQNEVAVVEVNGRPLRILGFRDHLQLAGSWIRTSAEARQWLEPTGEGDIIALQHSPDIMPVITGDLLISPSLKLVIAGHTHGGQVWLPIIGRPIVPSSYGQKYAYGHVRENDIDMYVTSGIGTSILPFRFCVPPEIVVLTIRSR